MHAMIYTILYVSHARLKRASRSAAIHLTSAATCGDTHDTRESDLGSEHVSAETAAQ